MNQKIQRLPHFELIQIDEFNIGISSFMASGLSIHSRLLRASSQQSGLIGEWTDQQNVDLSQLIQISQSLEAND